MQQNCPNCNQPVQPGQPQCQHCGYNLTVQNQQPPGNPATAGQPNQAPLPPNQPIPNQAYNPNPGYQQPAPNNYYNQGQVPPQPANPAYPNQPNPQMQQAPGYDQQQSLQQQPNYSFDGKPSNKKKIFIIVGIIGGGIIFLIILVAVIGLVFLGSKVRVAQAVAYLEDAGATCKMVEDVEEFRTHYESTLNNYSQPQQEKFENAFKNHIAEFYVCYESNDTSKSRPIEVHSADIVKSLFNTSWEIQYSKSFSQACQAAGSEETEDERAQETEIDYMMLDRQVVISRLPSDIEDKLKADGISIEEDVPLCQLY